MKINQHSWDKINHAYAFGGKTLAKETVENFLGISLDHTIVINFSSFKKIIDAIGKVELVVEKRMYYCDPNDDNGGLTIDLQPGLQSLDGDAAIQYVRYRDEEGDIGRVKRQERFLQAFAKKLSSRENILKLPELFKAFASMVNTDMTVAETYVIKAALQKELKIEFLAGTPVYIQDVSYWLPDIRKLRELEAKLQAVIVDEKYNKETELQVLEYYTAVPREFRVAE